MKASTTAAISLVLDSSAAADATSALGVTNQAPLSKPSTTTPPTRITAAGPMNTYSVAITTTITSPPSAYFTLTASNSDWTTDTFTSMDGTLRPVLVGCKVCGGPHHGIVLAGLGSAIGSGSEFDLSPLPPFVVGTDGTPIEEHNNDDGSSSSDCDDEGHCSLPTSGGRTAQRSSTFVPTSTTIAASISMSTSAIVSSSRSSEYLVFPKIGTTSDELTALAGLFSDQLGADNAVQASLNDAGDQVMYVIYANESFALSLPQSNPKVCNYFTRIRECSAKGSQKKKKSLSSLWFSDCDERNLKSSHVW